MAVFGTYHVGGPCTITWDAKPLGRTKEGVNIEIRSSMIPITDDDAGGAPASYIFGGKSIVVSMIFTEPPKAIDMLTADPLQGSVAILLSNPPSAGLGSLCSTNGQILQITEHDGASIWSAAYSIPVPQSFQLSSTQEIVIPVMFYLAPDSDGKFFQTLPTYIQA